MKGHSDTEDSGSFNVMKRKIYNSNTKINYRFIYWNPWKRVGLGYITRFCGEHCDKFWDVAIENEYSSLVLQSIFFGDKEVLLPAYKA